MHRAQDCIFKALVFSATQGAATCWFSEVALSDHAIVERGEHTSRSMSPATTLIALQRTIQQRKEDTSGTQAPCHNHFLSIPFRELPQS